jgi:hypothetical protein
LDRSGNRGIVDLRALIADGPQHRLHKGAERDLKAASGFNPARGLGRGLHRNCKIYGVGAIRSTQGLALNPIHAGLDKSRRFA